MLPTVGRTIAQVPMLQSPNTDIYIYFRHNTQTKAAVIGEDKQIT
jgi:hypothetical protein